jgi:hypothetical protein
MTSDALATQSLDILPAQFFRPAAARSSEHRLMIAVLEDAVLEFRRYAGEPGVRARRLFGETAAWFASDDTSTPFSFVTICEALDLDPSYLRSGLRRYRVARESTRHAAARIGHVRKQTPSDHLSVLGPR